MAIPARRADLLGAAAFAAACLAVLFVQPVSEGVGVTRPADAEAIAIVLLCTLPLALRRSFPMTVAAVVTPLSIFGALHGYAVNLTSLGALFALASAAYLTDRTRAAAIGAFAVAALLIGSVITGGPLLSLQLLVGNLAAPILAVVAGDVMRGRRDADRVRAVAQERVRLAREVHDIVGHHLAAIALQARAGGRRMEADPGSAAEAFSNIDELSSQALAETREAMGLICEPGELAPTAPVVSVT